MADSPFNGSASSAPVTQNGNGTATAANPQVEKIERDCIKLIDAISEIKRSNGKQTLRGIADLSGLSKDEVNRYLNPQVNELYNLDRLLVVRGRNRGLYNWLIVSGPPKKGDDGKWAGIMANTSKHQVFKAVAQRFGYEVKFIGDRGVIVDLVYRGIQNVALARMGKTWASQEPIVHLDDYR